MLNTNKINIAGRVENSILTEHISQRKAAAYIAVQHNNISLHRTSRNLELVLSWQNLPGSKRSISHVMKDKIFNLIVNTVKELPQKIDAGS